MGGGARGWRHLLLLDVRRAQDAGIRQDLFRRVQRERRRLLARGPLRRGKPRGAEAGAEASDKAGPRERKLVDKRCNKTFAVQGATQGRQTPVGGAGRQRRRRRRVWAGGGCGCRTPTAEGWATAGRRGVRLLRRVGRRLGDGACASAGAARLLGLVVAL
eukprot:7364839-Prymnesium_polylepis.1